jgi:UDP-GlcNAc:undecaprenyl-phosphate GlcNAc-1-phosphate transferase
LLYLISITSSIFIFFFIYLNKNIIARKLKLYDIPDNKLKLHQKKTPRIGGIILTSSSLITFIISIIYKDTVLINLLILTYFCFFFGLLDDIYNIKANKKIIILTLIFFIFLMFFPDLLIKQIHFNNIFFNKIIYLDNKIYMSFFLTILSYQLLINAFNMSDGHNGISSLMAISIISYILIFKLPKVYIFFLVPILISLLLFLIYNIRSKIFLGDSGNYFLSTLFGSLIIISNNNYNNIRAEEIFILLMLPGIDMLRLFYIRIKNKKNPLHGDRNHFHHILIKKFNKKKIIIIYYLLFIIPIVSIKILHEIFIIISFIFFYFLLMYKK